VVAGQGLTEAVIFDGSTLPAPAAHLFGSGGETIASLASDRPPESLVQQLRPLTERPLAYAAQGVAYLPVLPRCRLLIVGGGHVGRAVADLAVKLEFDVWVIDDREDIVSAQRFPTAQRRIAGDIAANLKAIDITPDTYCLIVTRGHNHDEEALYYLAERGARFVGMIGSRRKIKLIFEELLDKGISRESLQRVYAPLGIDIGSQTVPEIAVSICAELIAHRNRGEVPGRAKPVEF
jgi:xanthine dehydrogenase accessory factor